MRTATATSSSLDVARLTRRRRIARRALAVLRVLLAIEFAGAGLMKLAAAEPMVILFADIGAGRAADANQGTRGVVTCTG